MSNDAITAARASAERTLGFSIPDEVANEVFAYAKRKCDLNRKPDSYLPPLYENELTDHYARLAINLRGAMNHVRHLQTVAV